MKIDAAIAANRFGLGTRPGRLQQLNKNPRSALLAQLQGPSSASADLGQLPRSDGVLAEVLRIREWQRELKKRAGNDPVPKSAKKYASIVRAHYMDQVAARFRHAVQTDYPFHERLVRFWSNHFAVSADKQPVSVLACIERSSMRAKCANYVSHNPVVNGIIANCFLYSVKVANYEYTGNTTTFQRLSGLR